MEPSVVPGESPPSSTMPVTAGPAVGGVHPRVTTFPCIDETRNAVGACDPVGAVTVIDTVAGALVPPDGTRSRRVWRGAVACRRALTGT